MRRVAFPDLQQDEHAEGCDWWNDWHACNCGALDVKRYENVASRIADQLDAASLILRQSPLTSGDLRRVMRVLQSEKDLLLAIVKRELDDDRRGR